MNLALVLCVLSSCFLIANSVSFIPPDGIATTNCETFRTLLTRTLVDFSSAYLVDQPRLGEPPFNPDQLPELTPGALFTAYYGNQSSSRDFEHVILRILYSDPGPQGATGSDQDRIVLRNNVYQAAKLKTQSGLQLAREKFGLLLYLDAGDQVGDSGSWRRRRCVLFKHTRLVVAVIDMELEKLRNELGDELFSRFMDFSTGSTLAIAIDDTGTMGPVIQSVQERVKVIIEERKGTLDAPHDFVLSPFNDPTIGPLTVTSDSTVFIGAVDNLTPSGGGDSPELALSGILAAIESSKLGSKVFVFTDSEAKDVELQSTVISRAQQKDISIIFLVTGKITHNACQLNPLIPHTPLETLRCTSSSFLHGEELYRNIAKSTNGQYLSFSQGNANEAAMLLEPKRHGTVLIVSKTVTSDQQTVVANIDRSVSEVFLKFTGSCTSTTVTLNDQTLLDLAIDKNGFETSLEVNNRVGRWEIITNIGQGSENNRCNVKVTGRSSMGFIPSLAKQKIVNGQRLLEKFPDMQPKLDDIITILIDAYGKLPDEQVTSIDLINPYTENVLQTHNLHDMTSANIRLLLPSPPTEPFLVTVNGRDVDGNLFSRVLPCTIEFVEVTISCDNFENVILRPDNQRVVVSVTITNNGPFEQEFDVAISEFSNRFLVRESLPTSSVEIRGGGGSEKVQFQIRVAPNVPVGTSVILSVIVSSVFESPVTQTCRLVVGQRSTPDIESFHVNTDISGRFAQTNIISTVHNNANIVRRAEFSVLIPIIAFISNFSLEIDGVFFQGRIEEESRLVDLDLVGSVVARTDRVFRTMITLDPLQTVIIRLSYQQIMIRINSMFTYEVAVVLQQPVLDFQVDVRICETDEITNLEVVGFRTDQSSISDPLPVNVDIITSGNTANVLYAPGLTQQTELSPFGLNGRFSLEYGVKEDPFGFGVYFNNMFVHFYTPNFERIPKRIVFVLDKSGSMRGIRIAQLKIAMTTILTGFDSEDSFNIVLFDSGVRLWRTSGLLPGTLVVRDLADRFVQGVSASGGTNILEALLAGINLLEEAVDDTLNIFGEVTNQGPLENFLVFLTDGEPTVGIVDQDEIVRRVQEQNGGRFAIHSIGLGDGVPFPFLQRLSATNDGTAIEVLVDFNTNLQISNFFERIAIPSLSNFVINFKDDRIRNVTQQRYSGIGNEEFITFGTVDPREQFEIVEFDQITAGRESINGSAQARNIQDLCPDSNLNEIEFLGRLRDFLQLDALIEQSKIVPPSERDAAELRVLNAALSFNLVVPRFTAIVVERPEDDVRKTIHRHIDKRFASSTQIRVMEMLTEMSHEQHLNPHIRVNINPQLEICFNWEGKANEIYNIAQDPISGVSVNVKLQQGPYKTNSNLYLSEIGMVFANNGINFIIGATSVVINIGKAQTFEYSTEESLSLLKRGIQIEIQPSSVHSSRVTIRLFKRIELQVVTHMHLEDMMNHVELVVNNMDGFSNRTKGILSVFPKSDLKSSATIDFMPYKTEQASLKIKQSEIEVTSNVVYNSATRKFGKCWLLESLLKLTGGKARQYRVSHVTAG